MTFRDSIVAQREGFGVRLGINPLGAHKSQPLQRANIPSEPVLTQPTAAVAPRLKTSAQRSDDLDAAKGILFGIIIGSVCWGLLGGAFYLFFS